MEEYPPPSPDQTPQPYMPPEPQRQEPAADAAQASYAPQSQPQQYAAPQPYAAAQASKKRSHAWIVAIVAIAAITAVLIVSVASCSSVMGGMTNLSSLLGASAEPYTGAGEPSVAIIEIDGTIQYDGSACSPDGLKELLDAAEEDNNVKALVLHVNSGGGTSTAGEEMSVYVKDFSKPVVVSSASINASAAYMISSQADSIYVARTTEIGSIGTLMQTADLSGLYDKLGIKLGAIASADNKDAGASYRPLTEEEHAWYQDMVNKVNDVFIQTVAEGRDMSYEDVKKLANGMVWIGEDAIGNGLADEIGTLEDAVACASEIAGYSKPLPTIQLAFSSSGYSVLDLLGKAAADGAESAGEGQAPIAKSIVSHSQTYGTGRQ